MDKGFMDDREIDDSACRMVLNCGAVTLVDADLFDDLNKHTWRLSQNGYARRNRGGESKDKDILLHRVVNQTPDGFLTDHINCNRLDNRKRNLRSVTSSENNWNKGSFRGTSRFKGVCWRKRENKWVAVIRFKKRPYHLGYFHSEIDAAKAYNEAAKKYHGEYAYLNEIDQEASQ